MSPVPENQTFQGCKKRRHVLKNQHECVQIHGGVLYKKYGDVRFLKTGDLWDHRKREFTILLNTAKLLGYDVF